MFTVKQVLQDKGSDVWTIKPDQTVYSALKLMAEKNLGAVVVEESGVIKGIFSERDYARRSISGKVNIKEAKVSDLMTVNLITASLNETLDQCMAMMTDKKIRHIPIIDNGKLVGIISIGDIVNRIISDQEFNLKEMKNYILGSTL
ncbi:MAG: histidine kinase [Omnitrophica WOR_2 bacterium GWF2_38_59]|nr:MAG: histidine kinase [Omnitrophica WOR_2 bacterium GWA2_37_7]OGX22255.1 MAG: histidine kinase [Omnitrophica WOR_2 bacterium GWF2_38_59]OGX50825.1 MAG: histidine kinase [Omnitrophica WOR_2 bacterium RIFOXYA2_FULL_38_17]OGX53743.1 MAG: histidine kinase [Omnitrophica WOR_2 bacterium RIFOXYA12_FULL_38_10]OGX57162.1 MAG: histidine kinase [Omnitrophica WOR_2 bacterium RIFOXYC2_FULL_38_12]OGX59065.1 MAG: histidine kinase [Omnitrophica WOR_2 bacterium RIFOXYB2_FULL_38_16]HBG60535.1 histidine kina